MTTHRHAHDHVAPPEHAHRVEQDMLSVEEAYDRIMAGFKPLQSVEVPLLDALGHVYAWA